MDLSKYCGRTHMSETFKLRVQDVDFSKDSTRIDTYLVKDIKHIPLADSTKKYTWIYNLYNSDMDNKYLGSFKPRQEI